MVKSCLSTIQLGLKISMAGRCAILLEAPQTNEKDDYKINRYNRIKNNFFLIFLSFNNPIKIYIIVL